MPALLYLLALAVFAQGTSEFVLSGLLPGISNDLNITLAEAGSLTSAFAVGMIIGAPAMALLGRRFSPRAALSSFLLIFIAAHAVGAITDSFTILFVSRIIAAVANAGFLAVALSVVVRIVDEARRSRAIGVILAGTTSALIIGVPAGAFVGSSLGWRNTLWAIALLSVPALIAVFAAAPRGSEPSFDSEPVPEVRTELRSLKVGSVQLFIWLAVLVNAATFGAFTFWAVTAESVGVPEVAVPLMLGVFGVGAFLGVTVSGRFGDAHWARLVAVLSPMLVVGWVLLAIVLWLMSGGAAGPATVLWVFALVMGLLSFALGSTLISRIIAAASAASSLGGAFATVALNLGAAIGPLMAGASLGIIDITGPVLVSAACALLAWGGWLVFRRRGGALVSQ